MTEETGHAKAVTDDAEVQIGEGHRKLRNDLQVIDQHNADEAIRETALKMVEKYLGGQEYDIQRLTAEIQVQVGFITTAYIEIGRKLLIIKEVEGHGNFTKWLEANFPLSAQQARKFMKVALRLESDPKLQALAKGGITKALCLLDLPEDDLEEFKEEGTIYGTPLEDWQLKSAKELAADLAKEKKNRDKIIAEETKGLKAENAALVKQCKDLQKFAPVDDATPEWALSQVTELTKATLVVVSLAQQFLNDERLNCDMVTRNKIDGNINLARNTLDKFYREWIDAFNPEI
ncbi:DUF3102 domain-containing protein [Desulfobulbus sp.]|uniref:DUF3102 domain-containing protein n=1 Tax=Desulfobulbus sp. TaxID=895 RepID=UPI0027B9C49D|nr:DUF3102 domain-containing protein [Desulfobulbus sp.]